MARRDQQSRRILALDAEILAINRELRTPVAEVGKEFEEATREARALDLEIAKQEAALSQALAAQRAAAEKFRAYREKFVLDHP